MIIEVLRPWAIILIGLLLVVLGAALPVLMCTKLVGSTFLLNALSYSASVVGVLFGVIGSCLKFGRSRMWEPQFRQRLGDTAHK